MEISSRATTLSQHGENKRYNKAVAAHPYLKQLKFPIIMPVVGSSGSRKTSFLLSFLKDIQDSSKLYDIIVFYSGARDNNEMFEQFETKKTEVKIFNDFREDEFESFISELEKVNMKRKEEKKRMLQALVVFDDPLGLVGLRQGTARAPSVLDRLATTARHINLSMIILIQRYRLLSHVLRNSNLTQLVIMGVKKSEIEEIAMEHSYDLVDDSEFIDAYNDIRSRGDGQFLVVNYQVPKVFRLQENFIPIVDKLKQNK